MKPSDFIVSTAHLDDDAYAAPETRLDRAASAWEDEAADRGLTLRAYARGSGRRGSRHLVTWCVDEEEDRYLIEYDPAVHQVHAVYDCKATRNRNQEGQP